MQRARTSEFLVKHSEFISKHKQRNSVDKDSHKQIDAKNRKFLEQYFSHDTSLSYYYALYLYEVTDNDSIAQFNMGDLNFNGKLEFKIDKEKGKKYLRTGNNKQEIEKINRKLIDKLYKKKYYELDSSGQVAYWIGKYFIKGYGTDKQPTKDDINNYKVLLKLAVDKNLPNAQHDYAVLLFTNGSKEECFKYLIKAKDQNYLPSMYLLGKLYYDEGKYLLKGASELGSKEAT
ncbi:hypothetical protein F8M41_011387 [Gigaspora margarita]|uniref:Sel1 repeat family protein n=1 Tax=Gigaspora margarita TaxID=4874 RepID=A0A8H4EQ30_GIGMA|nr:hypothetical protein F8M41_011387 [Gigaspora margarita]